MNAKLKLTLSLAAAMTLAGAAYAGDIAIEHPWSRATATGAPVGAGYATIKNNGATADKLLSATADVAGKVEVHEMTMDNGVMKMRPINGLEVPAGMSVELKPGGYHIMFMQLKRPLAVGETVKGVMTFEKAGAVPVEYKVEAMGAKPMDAKGMDGHKSH